MAIKGILEAASEEDPQVDAGEAQEIEEFVAKGFRVIYNESDAIGQMVVNGQNNKVESAANALELVVAKIERSREQEKRPPFEDTAKLLGSHYLNEKIADLAPVNGGEEFSPEEKDAAFALAMERYIKKGIDNGTLDAKELAVAAEKAQPGSMKNALAKLPPGPGGPSVEAASKPISQGAPPQAGPGVSPQAQGAPQSPLERFLA